jgi:hypothetical protein
MVKISTFRLIFRIPFFLDNRQYMYNHSKKIEPVGQALRDWRRKATGKFGKGISCRGDTEKSSPTLLLEI